MGCNLRNQLRSQRRYGSAALGMRTGTGTALPGQGVSGSAVLGMGTGTGTALPGQGVSGRAAPGSARLGSELHPLLPTHPEPWD